MTHARDLVGELVQLARPELLRRWSEALALDGRGPNQEPVGFLIWAGAGGGAEVRLSTLGDIFDAIRNSTPTMKNRIRMTYNKLISGRRGVVRCVVMPKGASAAIVDLAYESART